MSTSIIDYNDRGVDLHSNISYVWQEQSNLQSDGGWGHVGDAPLARKWHLFYSLHRMFWFLCSNTGQIIIAEHYIKWVYHPDKPRR